MAERAAIHPPPAMGSGSPAGVGGPLPAPANPLTCIACRRERPASELLRFSGKTEESKFTFTFVFYICRPRPPAGFCSALRKEISQ